MCHHTVGKYGDVCSPAPGSWPRARPGVRGLRPRSPPGAGPRVARWPLSLSPFVLFISGSPGGSGARSAARSPPPAARPRPCPAGRGLLLFRRRRRTRGAPRHRGLGPAPTTPEPRARGHRGACACAAARLGPARGGRRGRDGPGGRAPAAAAAAAGGRQARRRDGGPGLRLQRGRAERVRHQREPVGGAARAAAAAAGGRRGGGRPAAGAAALQPGTAAAADAPLQPRGREGWGPFASDSTVTRPSCGVTGLGARGEPETALWGPGSRAVGRPWSPGFLEGSC